jgi:hypothetical protein
MQPYRAATRDETRPVPGLSRPLRDGVPDVRCTRLRPHLWDQIARRKLQPCSPQPCELRGCSVAKVDPVTESAIQTPDGTWRVEVVKRGRDCWYRTVHGDNVIDWLALGSVERILCEAGVDLGAMVDGA